MVNKKGFIKTLEAVIAVILIISFLFYVINKSSVRESEVPKNIEEAQTFILNAVSENKTFRECIVNSIISVDRGLACKIDGADLNNCVFGINEFVKKNIPAGYDYECEICGKVESCVPLPDETIKKSIYVKDSFIAAKQSKIFRIYVWRKG